MSRKHYIAIARIVSAQPDAVVRRDLAMQFADMLKADNHAFDHARFFKACNV